MPHDVHELQNLFVHTTHMLGQDEHHGWGSSSITSGETASSNVLKDLCKDGGCRLAQLTQKPNDNVNSSVVILMRFL